MTYSMTAFSRQQLEQEWGALTWEVRSVNHRYLETSIRLPDTFRAIESLIRDAVRKKLSRGKVECQLRFQASPKQQGDLHLNQDVIRQLQLANSSLRQAEQTLAPLSVADILRWPGAIQEPESDMEAMQAQAVNLFSAALDDLLAARLREGEELSRLVEQRLQSIAAIIDDVRQHMPTILSRQRQAIVERLEELQVELDPTRLEQELVLIAQKADVDEEMDRLEAHVNEVRRVLQTKEPVGRRLDFLMQELNREANTLSSKSIVVETTRNAVELKVLIEQMREQIQNIE